MIDELKRCGTCGRAHTDPTLDAGDDCRDCCVEAREEEELEPDEY